MSAKHEMFDHLKKVLAPDMTMESLIENGCLELEKRLNESDISMLSGGTADLPNFEITETSSRLQIAVDLGGSFVKVGLLDVTNLNVLKCESLPIRPALANTQFFRVIVEWICRQANQFLCERGIDTSTITFELGMTFGFPLTPHGEITDMGKGYQMSHEVRGVKMTELMQQLFCEVTVAESYKFSVYVRGVINDSVAVFLANAATKRGNDISLILGTGINACFSLPTERVPERKYSGSTVSDSAALLINSEIGFLGQYYVKLSEFDPKNEALFMPLEYVTAGKWIPLTLYKIVKSYNLLPESVEHIEFDGKLVCDILAGSTAKTFGAAQTDIAAAATMLIDRAAFYATGALLSIIRFVGEDTNKNARLGYAGSFLKNCALYKSLVHKFSNGVIELEFLEHSNLIGAHVNALLCQT
ncbi:LAME_0E09076g1_1 [Lachancea meyersii CBS 8951]|uniref:Phosphotransferase n=1 Tax=Lachancea meyersii CBS 8951 TaxID=1266667 RepID=A0A1G4JJ86_9SACH|nr:LAME_0E09076g1_1 [Lachancea meyersii CBS 8951]